MEQWDLSKDLDLKHKNSGMRAGDSSFAKFLISKFGRHIAARVIKEYEIGNSNYIMPGASVFWYKDINGKIRTGKCLYCDMERGKRLSNRMGHGAMWVHHPEHYYNLCFFGEHLVNKYPEKKIGIVESEECAVICSAYYPDVIWLACGGPGMLYSQKLCVLSDREYVAYPNTDYVDEWNCICEVKRWYKGLIEVKEMDKGFDLADYLLNLTGQNKS